MLQAKPSIIYRPNVSPPRSCTSCNSLPVVVQFEQMALQNRNLLVNWSAWRKHTNILLHAVTGMAPFYGQGTHGRWTETPLEKCLRKNNCKRMLTIRMFHCRTVWHIAFFFGAVLFAVILNSRTLSSAWEQFTISPAGASVAVFKGAESPRMMGPWNIA
jgi:hypothetical protein